MAQELDDGEFWLPSEFLTDEDLLMDFKNDDTFGFNSDLSSPVESLIGSTETESDEDELISRLTREMTNSTLSETTTKGLKLSGSPQSTLCGFKPASSQSSPISVSRVSSPPPIMKDGGWDFLSAAAGEVARIQSAEETASFHLRSLFAPPPKPEPVKKTDQVTGYYPNHAQTEAHIAYLKFQAAHFQRMKLQMLKNDVWGQEKMDYQFQNGKLNGAIGRNQGLSATAWPTLQQSQQEKTGMGSVFLGESGAKKERTGTGVFLPRFVTPEPRRKTGRHTAVLIPDKVVYALNLNPEYDAAVKQRNNILMGQQRKTHIPQAAMNQELRLPQEWTY